MRSEKKKVFNHKDDFITRNTYRLTKIADTNANSTTTTIVTDIPYIKGTKNRYHQANHTTLQYPRSPQIDHYLEEIYCDHIECNKRQGAVYKIKWSDCQDPYIGETGRNLITRLTEHKRAMRNTDVKNHIAQHH